MPHLLDVLRFVFVFQIDICDHITSSGITMIRIWGSFLLKPAQRLSAHIQFSASFTRYVCMYNP